VAIPAATERAEQIPLIEDPGLWRARSIDLPALQQSYADLRQRQTHAPETRRNYQSDWEQFTAWCTDAVRSPLPASDETIAMYAFYCGQTSGHTVSTIERRLSAIRKLHRDAGFPSPTGEHVRQVVRLLKREKGTRPKQKNRHPSGPVARDLASGRWVDAARRPEPGDYGARFCDGRPAE
jgi:hypothetical protein